MNVKSHGYLPKLSMHLSIHILVATCAFSAAANEQNTRCDQSDQVTFLSHDIFDLSDANTIFLHRWANFFHIKTKQFTLNNEAAFFIEKCQLDEQDLKELERHLRSKKYLRDARVNFEQVDNKAVEQNKVNVETWDNWSLMPTVGFGRKGGKNKSSIGIKDRNLLGLGIDAEIEYYNNDQRTGYKFDSQFPLFLRNNINGSIRISDNDDGNSKAFFIQKKFVSFATKKAYKIGFDNFDQIDTQYENGLEANRFQHKRDLAAVSWHWLENDTRSDTLRFGFGYRSEKHQFLTITDNDPVQTTLLPKDRSFNYPFVSAEYLQKDYRKLTNLNLINQIEDFNLGWHLRATLGKDFSNNTAAPTLLWQSKLSKGVAVNDQAYLFFNAAFEGELYSNGSDNPADPQLDSRYFLTLETEYFHKLNEQWGAYFKNTNKFSKNQFLDEPLVLDDLTGVRGFPLQYQHGESSIQATFEARYYPHINIYKLFELGGAVFVDTGRIYGQSELSNAESASMTSVGLGARLYSTHSSEAQVLHFDIIKPISSDPNVNSVEFRITSKHSF